MTTTEATACFEPDDHRLHVEVTVELNLYYEPSDPSVGIFGDDFQADGWEHILGFHAWYATKPEHEAFIEWKSSSPHEAEAAYALMVGCQPKKYCQAVADLIDEACNESARGYESPEPDYNRGDYSDEC